MSQQQKFRKFTPVAQARRKISTQQEKPQQAETDQKKDEAPKNELDVQMADVAEENQNSEFQDIIKAAKQERLWDRKSAQQGRRQMIDSQKSQQQQQVTFGGYNDKKNFGSFKGGQVYNNPVKQRLQKQEEVQEKEEVQEEASIDQVEEQPFQIPLGLIDTRQFYPIQLPIRNLNDPESSDYKQSNQKQINSLMQDLAVQEDRNFLDSDKLGLLESSNNYGDKFILFQMPFVMPFFKQSAIKQMQYHPGKMSDVNSISGLPTSPRNRLAPASTLQQQISQQYSQQQTFQKQNSTQQKGKERQGLENKRAAELEDLKSQPIGKMRVYESGKVEMLIGNVSFDVSSGVDQNICMDSFIINSRDKQAVHLGQLDGRLVVHPTIQGLLDLAGVAQPTQNSV